MSVSDTGGNEDSENQGLLSMVSPALSVEMDCIL